MHFLRKGARGRRIHRSVSAASHPLCEVEACHERVQQTWRLSSACAVGDDETVNPSRHMARTSSRPPVCGVDATQTQRSTRLAHRRVTARPQTNHRGHRIGPMRRGRRYRDEHGIARCTRLRTHAASEEADHPRNKLKPLRMRERLVRSRSRAGCSPLAAPPGHRGARQGALDEAGAKRSGRPASVRPPSRRTAFSAKRRPVRGGSRRRWSRRTLPAPSSPGADAPQGDQPLWRANAAAASHPYACRRAGSGATAQR